MSHSYRVAAALAVVALAHTPAAAQVPAGAHVSSLPVLLAHPARDMPVAVQDTPVVPAGTAVRVLHACPRRDGSLSTCRQRGTLHSASPDSLQIRTRDAATTTFAWQDVAGLERSIGTRPRPIEGALLGVAFGAGVTLGVAVAIPGFCGNGREPIVSACYALAGGFTATTGVLGALVGLLFRTERWRQVPISAVRPE